MKKISSSDQSLPTKHERTKKVRPDAAEARRDLKPSSFEEFPWIYTRRENGVYPSTTELSGKWLIFTPVEVVDETWEIVKQATVAGKLGGSAKVATACPNQNASDPNRRVICVYTYDWTDETDVRRIREVLRELGFTEKLAYKADSDTRAGKYRNRGDTRISKYYE